MDFRRNKGEPDQRFNFDLFPHAKRVIEQALRVGNDKESEEKREEQPGI